MSTSSYKNPLITDNFYISMETYPVNTSPRFNVLWPLGKRAVNHSGAAPALGDLSGKVVGELWDFIFRGDKMYPMIREHLRALYPGIRFVDFTNFGNIHGNQDREIVAGLADALRGAGCDAVIAGIGA